MSSSFKNDFTQLLDFSREVCTHSPSTAIIPSGGVNINLSALTSFRKLFDKNPDGQGYQRQMTDIYSECKNKLTKCEDIEEFMHWFKSQKKGYRITPQAKSERYFALSNIYIIICNIVSSNPPKDGEEPRVYEVWPETFMLFLLRNFYHCTTVSEELQILSKHILQLEEILQVGSGEQPNYKDAMEDMYDYATELAQDFGIPIPKGGSRQFQPKDLKEVMSGIRNDPQTKAMIGKIFQGVNFENSNDIGVVFSRVAEGLRENATKVPDGIARAEKATASSSESV